MGTLAVEVNHLSKKFKIYNRSLDRIKEWLSFGKRKYHTDFWALQDISFSLESGNCLGIIGANGSGKSTLLKILTGVLWPTNGNYTINGKVVSLLELGTGFHPELTGIQNIYHSSNLMGYSDQYINKKIDKIIAFADIGEFINQPIKTYSSGMYVRLAFSLFANLEPDIYIVDEALSVGDYFFQQKCFRTLRNMIDSGTTVIFVSHDFDAVRNLCDKVIVLEKGEMKFAGNPIEGIHYYLAHKKDKLVTPDNTENRLCTFQTNVINEKDTVVNNGIINIDSFVESAYKRPENSDFCAKDLEILGIKVLDRNKKDRNSFEWGEELILQTLIKVNKAQEVISNGVLFFDRIGNLVWGSGTINCGINLGPRKEGDVILSELRIKLNLHPGEYGLTIGVSSPDILNRARTGVVHDRYEQFCSISILDFNTSTNQIVPFFGAAPIPVEVGNIIIVGD